MTRPPQNKGTSSGFVTKFRAGAMNDTAGGPVSDQAASDLLRHVPPHSVEAEQAVLGGVLLKPDSFYNIADILTEDDFYLPAHRFIFSSFLELFRKGAPIDLTSVGEQLKAQIQLEDVGGAVYLAELSHSVISAANAEYYAGIVRDKSLLRGLISSCVNVIGACFDPSREVQALLDEAEQSVFAISERTSGRTFKSAGELTKKVFDELEKRANRRELVTGVGTGYTRLDQMTAGFQPSDLIILAARPSMGKTALALNIAMRAAIRYNTPVAIFSLEMSMEQLMIRMLCSWAKVDVSKLRRGFLEDSDWQNLFAAADAFSNAPIYIDDSAALSPLELRARVRRLKVEKGCGMVVVDYLQLMRSSRRTDSRELEISDISRNLKGLAKELNIPVIALSQLNRKVEERVDKRPLLSDLRESGAIEQDADVIMFIYREAAYQKHNERPPMDTAEIIIGKQRNGPVGTVELMYIPAYTAFENVEREAHPSESSA